MLILRPGPERRVGRRGSVQSLHLVGLTPDHDGLVVSTGPGGTGESFAVPIDEALLEQVIAARTSARRAAASLPSAGPGRAGGPSSLTPRDIQSRLRLGHSVAEVAVAAGVDEAWIMRFAPPVLAEQSAAVAHAASLHLFDPRRGLAARSLSVSVERGLRDREVRLSPSQLDDAWSAHHHAGSEWVVAVTYRSKGRDRRAEWVVDLGEQVLQARNRLGGELGWSDDDPSEPATAGAPDPARPSARRHRPPPGGAATGGRRAAQPPGVGPSPSGARRRSTLPATRIPLAPTPLVPRPPSPRPGSPRPHAPVPRTPPGGGAPGAGPGPSAAAPGRLTTSDPATPPAAPEPKEAGGAAAGSALAALIARRAAQGRGRPLRSREEAAKVAARRRAVPAPAPEVRPRPSSPTPPAVPSPGAVVAAAAEPASMPSHPPPALRPATGNGTAPPVTGDEGGDGADRPGGPLPVGVRSVPADRDVLT